MKNLLTNKFAVNTGYVYSAQVFSGFAGFLMNFILIRYLNVNDYGLFSLYSSAAMMLASLIPLGFSDAFQKFGAQYAHSEMYPSLEKYFFQKLVRNILIFSFFSITLSSLICTYAYKRNDFTLYFIIAVINAALLSLWSFYNVAIQSKQNFRSYLKAQSVFNGLRLSLMITVWIAGFLTLSSTLLINNLVPLVCVSGFFLAVLLRPNKEPHLPTDFETSVKEFRKWILVSSISNIIIGNIDLSILARYHSNQTMAFYGVASKLTLPIHVAMTSLSLVLLPKFASNSDPDTTRKQLKKLLKLILPMGVILLALIFILSGLLVKVAGKEYAGTENLFRLSLLSTVIVFITNPPSTFLTAWGYTKSLAILNLIQLVIDLILDLTLIPRYGAEGALIATVAIYLVGCAFCYFHVFLALKSKIHPKY